MSELRSNMASFATIDEAYGGFGLKSPPFAKKHRTVNMVPAQKISETKGDTKTKSVIDEIAKSMPVADDEENNFVPSLPTPSAPKNAIEPFELQGHSWDSQDGMGEDMLDRKLDQCLHILKNRPQATGRSDDGQPGTEDVILYTLTGIFLIYVFDSFVSLGRRMKLPKH